MFGAIFQPARKYAWANQGNILLYMDSADPPVQNTWYEVFHHYDCRLRLFLIAHDNTGSVAKTIEVRWTVDSHILTGNFTNMTAGSGEYVYSDVINPEGGAYTQLGKNSSMYIFGGNIDLRAKDFKAEMRITSSPGVDQYIEAVASVETLESV